MATKLQQRKAGQVPWVRIVGIQPGRLLEQLVRLGMPPLAAELLAVGRAAVRWRECDAVAFEDERDPLLAETVYVVELALVAVDQHHDPVQRLPRAHQLGVASPHRGLRHLAHHHQRVGVPLGRGGRWLSLAEVPMDLEQVAQIGQDARLVAVFLAQPERAGGRLERRGRVAEMEATVAEHAVGHRQVRVHGRTLEPTHLGEGVRQQPPRLGVPELAHQIPGLTERALPRDDRVGLLGPAHRVEQGGIPQPRGEELCHGDECAGVPLDRRWIGAHLLGNPGPAAKVPPDRGPLRRAQLSQQALVSRRGRVDQRCPDPVPIGRLRHSCPLRRQLGEPTNCTRASRSQQALPMRGHHSAADGSHTGHPRQDVGTVSIRQEPTSPRSRRRRL
jgi:hypothetical protein